MQSTLNQQALDMLPRVKHAIALAADFEANQMIDKTIRACCNSAKTIEEMTEAQRFIFEEILLETFKHYNWIN